jgi:predicted histidine transporter YuiF (NhaC family)
VTPAGHIVIHEKGEDDIQCITVAKVKVLPNHVLPVPVALDPLLQIFEYLKV